MTGFFGRASAAAACIFTLFLTTGALAQTKTLTIAADEWCPINCAPQSSKQGVGIDLARRIFEPMGYKINYVIMPWSQSLKEVRAGTVDAVVGASRNDEKSLIFPDNPIYGITEDFYVLSASPWRYQGMHTLKGKRVGVIKDYGYGDEMLDYIKKNKSNFGFIHEAEGADALQQNIKKLITNGIDVLVENKAVMEYALRNPELQNKIRWAGGTDATPVYLAFSPALGQSKALAAQYDAAIRGMRASGALKPMYTAYNLTP